MWREESDFAIYTYLVCLKSTYMPIAKCNGSCRQKTFISHSQNAMLIFDAKGTGGIHVRSLKVFFVLMCEGRLRDKFLYLFRHFSDHSSNTLSRLGLTALLGAITQG